MPADSVDERLMMLSIHPQHVQRILDGVKTVELRRTRPAVEPGQPVAIYATSPRAAVVATCRIVQVEVGSPGALWAKVGAAAAIRRQEFDEYYEGVSSAVALHLGAVKPLASAVSLSEMRLSGRFQPPQTWHFLDHARLAQLFGRHPASAVLHGLLALPA